MPTFKHPCPYCDRFIDRAVAACPFCGQVDPFAPKRCQNCRKIVEDPTWVVCPSCGQSLIAPPPGAATTATTAGAGAAAPAASSPAAPAPNVASSGAAAQPATPPLPPRPPINPDAAPPVLKSAGACSGCGAALPAGARFCTVCGTLAGA
ncbi:MAG: zinc-ribbon domain-containing protein [Candidatus Limnocylindrales bacterium]